MSGLSTFRLAAATVACMLVGSLPSKAATYTFDFTSAAGYSIVGSFTTGSADGPGYDITSISGTIISPNPAASGSIQGLVPGNATPPSYLVSGDGNFYYDNIFVPTAPYFTTTGGMLFTSTTGFEYNLYGGGGCCGSLAGLTYLSTTDDGGTSSSAFYPWRPRNYCSVRSSCPGPFARGSTAFCDRSRRIRSPSLAKETKQHHLRSLNNFLFPCCREYSFFTFE